MYVVVRSGGKQYKVSQGDLLRVEKIEGEVGREVTLTEVHMVSDGNQVWLGNPSVPGASVSCEIVNQGRAKKVVVFKMRRRKNYRRKRGHRQPFTTLRVKEIRLPAGAGGEG